MKKSLLLFLFLIVAQSSFSLGEKEHSFKDLFNDLYNKAMQKILYPVRFSEPKYRTEEEKLAKELYINVSHPYQKFVDALEVLLKDDRVNPDYCKGECGWHDSNPLAILAEGWDDSYPAKKEGKEFQIPDIETQKLYLLVKAGADINRRPYVWARVYAENNTVIESLIRWAKQRGIKEGSKEMEERVKTYVEDVNRLLEEFILAGADPDKKGHPYPYDFQNTRGRITDEEANKYFEKGSRPINIAIEKGIVWESQVDLLLKYVKLDKESLKAAERSNDPLMIEKINTLWEKQHKD